MKNRYFNKRKENLKIKILGRFHKNKRQDACLYQRASTSINRCVRQLFSVSTPEDGARTLKYNILLLSESG